MFPCGAQVRVSLLPAAAVDTQAGENVGTMGQDGTDDAVLRMLQGMLQSRAVNPNSQQ